MTERVTIHSAKLVATATIDGLDENGQVQYEDFGIGERYTLDLMALPEDHPVRVAILEVLQDSLERKLL